MEWNSNACSKTKIEEGEIFLARSHELFALLLNFSMERVTSKMPSLFAFCSASPFVSPTCCLHLMQGTPFKNFYHATSSILFNQMCAFGDLARAGSYWIARARLRQATSDKSMWTIKITYARLSRRVAWVAERQGMSDKSVSWKLCFLHYLLGKCLKFLL